MDVSLDLLRTFVEVYRTGSVARAAEQLHLAQPTVTGQMRELEASLGRRLFERRHRGIAPTPDADDLALRLTSPLAAISEALNGGATRQANLTHAVHLGGPSELVSAVIVPALADLVRDGLRLHVTLGQPGDLLPALSAGRLDLVISAERPPRSGVRSELIGAEELVLVGTPEWARRLRAPMTRAAARAALESVPLLACAGRTGPVSRYWRHAFGRPLERPADLVVPDRRGVLAAVLAGAGVGVLPRYLCRRELERNELRLLFVPAVPPSDPLYLLRREGIASYFALEQVRSRVLQQGRST